MNEKDKITSFTSFGDHQVGERVTISDTKYNNGIFTILNKNGETYILKKNKIRTLINNIKKFFNKTMKKLSILTLFLFLTAMCPNGQNKVIHVSDGDTITVEGYEKPIRILGIDTCETRRGERLKRQAKRMGITEDEALKLGISAKEQARKILLNNCVVLQSDNKDKGRFGRYLRYIQVDEMDYQEFMLKEGLAMSYCGDKASYMYQYYNKLSKWKCK